MSANLKGIPREKLGSRSARVLRAQNRIPCSIQGEEKPNIDLSIDKDEFAAARRHHEHLFDIEIGKGDPETAMVRELQWDALGTEILHVEFHRVVRGQKTEAEVELEFTGHPKGGVLNTLVTHVTIRCLPSEIPDSIEVPVGEFEHGHPCLGSDLVLPEGMELAIPDDTQIAVVVAVRADEAEVAEGEGEDEDAIEGVAPASEGTEEPKSED